MDMMSLRRAILLGSREDGLLYKLSNPVEFDGSSTYVDTGIQSFKENKDFTIVCEFYPNESQINNATVFHCMREAKPYAGFACDYGSKNYERNRYATYSSVTTNVYANGVNNKMVVTYDSSIYTFTIYSLIDGSTTTENSITNTAFNSIDNTVLLGAYVNTKGAKGRYFTGIIYDFKIYDKIWNTDKINNYLSSNERADGRQIMCESIGAFPDMTPVSEVEKVTEEVTE